MSTRRSVACITVLPSLLVLTSGCKPAKPALAPVKPPVVTIAQPVVKPVAEYAEYTGKTSAVQTVEVRARVGGYLNSVDFSDGALVKEGDVLFQIDPRPFQAAVDQAKAELAKANAVLDKAKVDWERIDKLYKANNASIIEWSTNKAARDAAIAAVDAAKANLESQELNLGWTKVTAPISGRAGRRLVDVGNLITGGTSMATPLTTIVSIDPMYAYFDIDERTVLEIQRRIRELKMAPARGQRAVPLELALANEVGFPHQGFVDFVNNRVDPATGTLQVRGEFPNADNFLTDGLFVRVRFVMTKHEDAVLVLERAIMQDQSTHLVYVVDAQQKVEARPVVRGPQEGPFRVIEEGLKRDDWVIVNGAQRVRPGVVVDPQRVEMLSLVVGTERAALDAAGESTSTTSSVSTSQPTRP